jgi:hypothetical protein
VHPRREHFFLLHSSFFSTCTTLAGNRIPLLPVILVGYQTSNHNVCVFMLSLPGLCTLCTYLVWSTSGTLCRGHHGLLDLFHRSMIQIHTRHPMPVKEDRGLCTMSIMVAYSVLFYNRSKNGMCIHIWSLYVMHIPCVVHIRHPMLWPSWIVGFVPSVHDPNSQ